LEVRSDLRRPARGMTRLHARGMRSAIPQLDPGESAVIVEAIAHRGEIPYVAFIPDPRRYARRVIGLGVNRAVLGADPGPAALGLDAPVVGLHAGLLRPRADA